MDENTSLFESLNLAAASLQRSAHSEAEVFEAYRREITRLGLRGNISLIDQSGENLVIKLVFMPPHLQKALQRIKTIIPIQPEGFTFPIDRVEIYQRAIKTRKAVFCTDSREIAIQLLPGHLQNILGKLLASLRNTTQIVAPIVDSAEQVIGLITIGSEAGVTPQDVPAIETFAYHFSIALENARLFTAEKRQRQERELLDRALAALARKLELSALLRTVVESIVEVFGYTQVSIYLLKSGQLHLQHQVGYENVFDVIPITKGISGKAIRSGHPVFVEDVKNAPEFLGAIAGVVSEICVPLFDQGQPVGILNIESTQGVKLTEADLHLMIALGEHVNFAIERSRLYEEIRDLNTQLEQHVRERTTQLEAALRELEGFSYSVSHDLRAPLRGIQGFSQIIFEKDEAILDDETKKHLHYIMDSATRMGLLIDALLQFSRLTRAELNKHEINLSQIAETTLQKLQASQPQRQVTINIQPDVTAQADFRMMEIVLGNLFENAWKFTSKTEAALINFGSRIIAGETVFFVQDNGAGFNMKYANKLFEPFQHLHRIDEFPGEGAGLAITQRIIHRHGGRIWAEAEPGQGATFYFTL